MSFTTIGTLSNMNRKFAAALTGTVQGSGTYTISTVGSYTQYKFIATTGTNTLTIPSSLGSSSINILCVGSSGGSAGGSSCQGNSGAGQVKESSVSVPASGTVLTVTVGAKGSGGSYANNSSGNGTAGTNTSISGTNAFSTITSLPGGFGVNKYSSVTPTYGATSSGGDLGSFNGATSASGNTSWPYSGGNSTGGNGAPSSASCIGAGSNSPANQSGANAPVGMQPSLGGLGSAYYGCGAPGNGHNGSPPPINAGIQPQPTYGATANNGKSSGVFNGISPPNNTGSGAVGALEGAGAAGSDGCVLIAFLTTAGITYA